MTTANIEKIAELIDSQFGRDPDALMKVVDLLRQYEIPQLSDAVETWGEMIQAAGGDTKIARNMLGIMGKTL